MSYFRGMGDAEVPFGPQPADPRQPINPYPETEPPPFVKPSCEELYGPRGTNNPIGLAACIRKRAGAAPLTPSSKSKLVPLVVLAGGGLALFFLLKGKR